MKKESQMLKEKKEFVNLRKDMVKKACNTLMKERIDVFKSTLKDVRQAIYEETEIPVRTLERSPYKEIINTYMIKLQEEDSVSVIKLKKDLANKDKIIVQLRKQNKNLMTQLYSEGKI